MRRNGKIAAVLLIAMLIACSLTGCEIGHILRQMGMDIPTASATQTTAPAVDPTTQPSTPVTVPTKPVTVPTQPTQPPTVPTEPSNEPPTQLPTDPMSCDHHYDAFVTEATCVQPGFTTYTCTLCGDRYVAEYTDLAEHRYGQWSVKQEASCTGEGREAQNNSVSKAGFSG